MDNCILSIYMSHTVFAITADLLLPEVHDLSVEELVVLLQRRDGRLRAQLHRAAAAAGRGGAGRAAAVHLCNKTSLDITDTAVNWAAAGSVTQLFGAKMSGISVFSSGRGLSSHEHSRYLVTSSALLMGSRL